MATTTLADQARQTDGARREADLRLQQSRRMEAIGRLAGGIAHDLNNLLTVIRGYTDLALDDVRGTPLAADLAEVRKASERAVDLTRQLVAFGRTQVLAPARIDLNALLGDSARLLQRFIGEHIVLEYAPTADLWPVRADLCQVEQVLLTLAVNARDVMAEGGRLTIAASNTQVDAARGRELGVPPGDYVAIDVRDTATGMAAEVVERLFAPFFTTTTAAHGAGPGRATVRGLTRLHGGVVDVTCGPGAGSVFSVLLPRDASSDPDGVEAMRDYRRLLAKRTVLLVEDEPAVRSLARTVLEHAGVTVLEARNADDAVAKAAGHPGEIDLLLTDVIMPGGSGQRLVDVLRELRPATRAVFMSGYTGDELVHAHVDPGCTLLVKPFSPASLLDTAVRALTLAIP